MGSVPFSHCTLVSSFGPLLFLLFLRSGWTPVHCIYNTGVRMQLRARRRATRREAHRPGWPFGRRGGERLNRSTSAPRLDRGSGHQARSGRALGSPRSGPGCASNRRRHARSTLSPRPNSALGWAGAGIARPTPSPRPEEQYQLRAGRRARAGARRFGSGSRHRQPGFCTWVG